MASSGCFHGTKLPQNKGAASKPPWGTVPGLGLIPEGLGTRLGTIAKLGNTTCHLISKEGDFKSSLQAIPTTHN